MSAPTGKAFIRSPARDPWKVERSASSCVVAGEVGVVTEVEAIPGNGRMQWSGPDLGHGNQVRQNTSRVLSPPGGRVLEPFWQEEASTPNGAVIWLASERDQGFEPRHPV